MNSMPLISFPCICTFCSQVPNIDFEGLFGNMEMVIKVSKELLADLEISDAVGMGSGHCLRRNFFFFFETSWIGGKE